MSEIGLERVPSFLREVWALYGLGMAVLFMRFGARLRIVGPRKLQLDDLFAFIVMLMYTCDAATVHLIPNYPNDLKGSNVEAAEFQTKRKLTEEEIAQYTAGSKLQLTAWYSYTALLWCLKGTMLAFFYRITTGLKYTQLIKWISWSCILSYIAVVLTITFGCFPTNKNWQVIPDPGSKCTFKMQNFLVTVVLNVLTDAALLCIPLPLLWTLQVPLRKKIVIGLLICSGFFVIAAAIIRVVLTLGSSPSGTNINRWGVRETIVGIIAVNIPILRPIFTKGFWTGNAQSIHSIYHHGGKSTTAKSKLTSTENGPYEMTGSITDGRTTSEDRIIQVSGEIVNAVPADGIHVHKTFDVATEAGSSRSEDAVWNSNGKSSTMILHDDEI